MRRASPPGRTRPFVGQLAAGDFAPVRVIELVDLEATVQRGGKPHGIDGLVHRFLDQQCRHRRHLRDPTREFDCAGREFVSGKHLADHPQRVGLVGAYAVAGEQQFLGLARPELPRMSEVLDPAHAQPGADHIGEHGVLAGDDQIAAPGQHQPRRQHGPVHLGDGDLAQVAPPLGVFEVVVPLLAVA